MTDLSLSPILWQSPPAQLSLARNQIHLWLANTDEISQAQLQVLFKSLSPEEQQRSAKFRFEVDRQRFIASRGMLRSLLSHYLTCPPESIEFTYNAHGKPQLVMAINLLNLQFNVSHSASLTLVAIRQQHPVGVDLEHHREITDLTALAQRFFAVSESEAIKQLPVEQQPLSFFQYWTAKEALLKGLGVGISGLSQVELSIIDGEVEWLSCKDASRQLWSVQLFTPAPDFTGAIAAKTKQTLEIIGWQWFWDFSPPCSIQISKECDEKADAKESNRV